MFSARPLGPHRADFWSRLRSGRLPRPRFGLLLRVRCRPRRALRSPASAVSCPIPNPLSLSPPFRDPCCCMPCRRAVSGSTPHTRPLAGSEKAFPATTSSAGQSTGALRSLVRQTPAVLASSGARFASSFKSAYDAKVPFRPTPRECASTCSAPPTPGPRIRGDPDRPRGATGGRAHGAEDFPAAAEPRGVWRAGGPPLRETARRAPPPIPTGRAASLPPYQPNAPYPSSHTKRPHRGYPGSS